MALFLGALAGSPQSANHTLANLEPLDNPELQTPCEGCISCYGKRLLRRRADANAPTSCEVCVPEICTYRHAITSCPKGATALSPGQSPEASAEGRHPGYASSIYSVAPCKGNCIPHCVVIQLPLQGVRGGLTSGPRALPWASGSWALSPCASRSVCVKRDPESVVV